jgi:hypothetical protein
VEVVLHHKTAGEAVLVEQQLKQHLMVALGRLMAAPEAAGDMAEAVEPGCMEESASHGEATLSIT